VDRLIVSDAHGERATAVTSVHPRRPRQLAQAGVTSTGEARRAVAGKRRPRGGCAQPLVLEHPDGQREAVRTMATSALMKVGL
jgi:hypothetical protein